MQISHGIASSMNIACVGFKVLLPLAPIPHSTMVDLLARLQWNEVSSAGRGVFFFSVWEGGTACLAPLMLWIC